MKVYIVVDITKENPSPQIIGVYKRKFDAEKVAYNDPDKWRNIITTDLITELK